MKPEHNPEPSASVAPDQTLEQQVHAEIARACGNVFPAGVTMRVVERRVELDGCVADLDMVQRIEKAAAASPGLLGVQNHLRTRQPAPPLPRQVTDPRLGAPVARDPGQVDHKVGTEARHLSPS